MGGELNKKPQGFLFFIMAKRIISRDNSDLVKGARELSDPIGTQTQLTKELNKSIYGTDEFENIKDVTGSVNSLVSKYDKNKHSSLINNVIENNKRLSDRDVESLKRLQNLLENNSNSAMIKSILSGMDSQIAKYEDLMIITKIMPQLKKAKRSMVNSIMSPDDFTKQLSLSITKNGIPVSESLPMLDSGIKELFKTKKLTKEIKHIIDRTLTFGKYYEAVLPYDYLFGQILIKKQKSNLSAFNNEAVEINVETACDKEVIKEVFEKPSAFYNGVTKLCNEIEFCDNASQLFCEEVTIKEIKKKVDKDEKAKSIFDTALKNGNKYNKTSSSTKLSNDGMMDTKKLDLGITGCKIKRLDPRRLLCLKIDETVLGYYYIETIESMNNIRRGGPFSFKNNITPNVANNGIDEIYKVLGDTIYKKIDKQFIKDNIEFKEQIYDVLKYADATNNRLKVTYLEPQYVHEFIVDDGESVFEQSLYFAKLYMMLLLSYISGTVARSQDVRAYYVETDPQGGVTSLVNNAITTLKKQNRAFYSMTNLGKMMSNFNCFDDLYMAKTHDDKKPLDFDIIQGQDMTLNNDLMDTLERITVESSGTPLALIQSSNEVEFAKAYATLNLDFMRTILDLQIDFNPDIERYLKDIFKYELSNQDESLQAEIDSLSISLQSPMNLLLNNITEQINNAKDLANNLTEICLGQNGMSGDNTVSDKFIKLICEKYAPNVPWAEFDELLKKAKTLDATEKETDTTDETEV